MQRAQLKRKKYPLHYEMNAQADNAPYFDRYRDIFFIDVDMAWLLVFEKFEQLHPRNTWPEWFIKGASFDGWKKDPWSNWHIGFTMVKKQPKQCHIKHLFSNILSFFQVPMDDDVLQAYHYPEAHDAQSIILFEAEVDQSTFKVSVLKDFHFDDYSENEVESMLGYHPITL